MVELEWQRGARAAAPEEQLSHEHMPEKRMQALPKPSGCMAKAEAQIRIELQATSYFLPLLWAPPQAIASLLCVHVCGNEGSRAAVSRGTAGSG